MTVSQLLIQTAVTFVAASIGAFLAASLARRTERIKHQQQLRSSAYADLLKGVAKIARAQQDATTSNENISIQEEREGRLIFTDARSRIAIYGSRDVLRAAAKYIDLGAQTLTPEGRTAFSEMCSLMRKEAIEGTAYRDEEYEDVETLLIG
jgi:hypothetical protein